MRSEDRRDFEWLFRTAYPGVLASARIIVIDRAQAEEVAQEAFLKLYQNWHQVRGYERPEAWVRLVAVRLAVRQLQRERFRIRWERDRADEGDVVEQPLPDVDLMRAVATLTPMQRATVALYYFEDQPVGEIARALAVSESTIKQHLFRARAQLARLLRVEVGDDGR